MPQPVEQARLPLLQRLLELIERLDLVERLLARKVSSRCFWSLWSSSYATGSMTMITRGLVQVACRRNGSTRRPDVRLYRIPQKGRQRSSASRLLSSGSAS